MNFIFNILNSPLGVFAGKLFGLYVAGGIVVVVVESFKGNKPDFLKTVLKWPSIAKGYFKK